MTTFVLVHGGFHGGWCYQRVARLLRAAGHEVYTPTLTGLGERSHLAGMPINLETHVMDVVNVLQWEDLNDVVLLGHSYGGLIIAAVADRMPDRIATLVYLDAFVPNDGDSILSVHALFRDAFIQEAAKADGLVVPPRKAATFGVNAADEAWTDTKLTGHPLATFVQSIHLTGRYKNVRRRVYIYADGPAGAPAGEAYEQRRGEPGGQVFAVSPSGHDIMIDQPGKLADLLMQVG